MNIYSGKLVRVLDGDTIEVELDLGFKIYHNVVVRLRGINTPELDSPDPVLRGSAKRAKLLLEEVFREHPNLVVQTYKNTKNSDIVTFGRYVADVTFSHSVTPGLPTVDIDLVSFLKTQGY